MLATINPEAAKSAIQTKYSRTVATNGIVPVTYSWTTQAGLNALVNKANDVVIGLLQLQMNDTDATNTINCTIIDFATTTICAVNKTNVAILTLGNYLFSSIAIEFSDMTITVANAGILYCTLIGWKFTFT